MPFEKEIIESLTASVAEQVHDAVYRNAPAIFADLAKALTDEPDGGMIKATIKLGFYGYASTKAAAGVESLEWERKVKSADKDFQLLRMDLEQPELPGINGEGGPYSGSDAVGNFKGHIAAMEKKYDCKITFDAGARHVEAPASGLDADRYAHSEGPAGSPDCSFSGDEFPALLERAKALLEDHSSVCVAFLQHELRASWHVANGIMDRLREEGLVGPSGDFEQCPVIGKTQHMTAVMEASDDDDDDEDEQTRDAHFRGPLDNNPMTLEG